jgi:hypothetical protein
MRNTGKAKYTAELRDREIEKMKDSLIEKDRRGY